jgi:D-alanyl-D-alanine dipeptidase
VVVVALAGACGKKPAKDDVKPVVAGATVDAGAVSHTPTPTPTPADAPVVVVDAAAAATESGPIPADSTLLITSVTTDWDAVPTELTEWRRDPGKPWTKVRSWTGVVGHTGLAWGKGLHGNGPPPDQEGPMKLEGDGKAPAGVFTLDGSYGYAAAPPAHAALPYQQVDKSWHCVDDGNSQSYNKIVDADTVTVDWKSSEDMKRKDWLYTWVVQVGHNPQRLPGEGSCIFLHVWRSAKDGTVGCTAMPQDDIEKLLGELDPKDHPVLVQLTAPMYAALATAWALPAR